LRDAKGQVLPAEVAQIDDLTWALFPRRVFLEPGQTYTAQLGIVCGAHSKCTDRFQLWHFTIAPSVDVARGDTRSPPVPREEPQVAVAAAAAMGPGVMALTLPWIGILALGGAGVVLLLGLAEAVRGRRV
jgi:hypothetical protein